MSETVKMYGFSLFVLGAWISMLYMIGFKTVNENTSNFTSKARKISFLVSLMTMLCMFIVSAVK
jgi:hypothetical protein